MGFFKIRYRWGFIGREHVCGKALKRTIKESDNGP